MKRLPVIAALLLTAPFAAISPAVAGWVDAEMRPDLKHLWTPAPPFPFPTTPSGFKLQIERETGVKVLEVRGCKFTTKPARVRSSVWLPAEGNYICDQVFFEQSDPRGTQRCMGKFWWRVTGSAPMVNGDRFTETSRMGQKVLKNDCRWL